MGFRNISRKKGWDISITALQYSLEESYEVQLNVFIFLGRICQSRMTLKLKFSFSQLIHVFKSCYGKN